MNQPQSPPTSGTVTRSVLPSGIRLLTERIPHVRTVAVGIWVGVGSRYEPVEQHGISHFLEHLFFKGTATRSALEIAQAVDDIGGQMNAFTDREQTVFYVKVLSSHLDRALEIYADMLLHSTLAAESIERERQVMADERRYALSVLDHLLGGGMSSRLFQEIRERRGLVYSISSYAASYRDGGLFVVYAGMSPDAGPEVIRLTLVEIEKIARHRVDDAELHRAKESLKGGLMLGLESTGSRMSMLARSEVYHGRQISLDELIAKVDAVTAEEIQRMAADLFPAGRLSMAAIGPFRSDGQLATSMRKAFEGYVEAKA